MDYKIKFLKDYQEIPEQERKVLHMLTRINNAYLFYDKIIQDAKNTSKDATQIFLFAESVTALSTVIVENIISLKEEKKAGKLLNKLSQQDQSMISKHYEDLDVEDKGKKKEEKVTSFNRNVLKEFRDKIVSHYDIDKYSKIDKELSNHSGNLPFEIIDEKNDFTYYNFPVYFIGNTLQEAYMKKLIGEPNSENQVLEFVNQVLKLSKELFEVNNTLIAIITEGKIV